MCGERKHKGFWNGFVAFMWGVAIAMLLMCYIRAEEAKNEELARVEVTSKILSHYTSFDKVADDYNTDTHLYVKVEEHPSGKILTFGTDGSYTNRSLRKSIEKQRFFVRKDLSFYQL